MLTQMKTKPQAKVKLYNWRQLVMLAMIDMHREAGVPFDPSHQFDIMAGMRPDGPFVRLDMTPPEPKE